MREPSPTCQMPYLYSVEAVITIDYFHSPESVFSLDCCNSAFLVLIPSQTLETSFPNSPPEMLVFPRIPSLAHFSSISLFSLHNHIHAHLPLLKPKLISSSEVSQVLYPQLALGHFFWLLLLASVTDHGSCWLYLLHILSHPPSYALLFLGEFLLHSIWSWWEQHTCYHSYTLRDRHITWPGSISIPPPADARCQEKAAALLLVYCWRPSSPLCLKSWPYHLKPCITQAGNLSLFILHSYSPPHSIEEL